jgi:cobalt-zinc-cadmium efflux system membrane fusion protein
VSKRVWLLSVLILWLAACGRGPTTNEAANPPAHPAGVVVMSETAQKQAGIVVEQVERRVIPEMVEAPGQLVFDEDRTWHIGAITSGRVVEVKAGVGDRVQAGQVLARLFSEGVHEARAAYVKALAQLERARSQATYAREVRDRTRRLFALKAASRQQVESAENALTSAEASLADARAEVRKARAHLTEFFGLPLTGNAGGAGSAGAIPADDLVPVRATAAGIVVRRMITPGAVVSPGQELFTVSDPATLWMIANVNEADLSELHVGQKVRIRVRAYPDKTFDGQVTMLGEELDPRTRTLRVRVLVPNPEGALRAEMYANAEIERRSKTSALFVPESAEQEINGQAVVFVRISPDRFEPRPIRIAQKANRMMQVSEGLAAGDSVVTHGSFILKTELFRSSLAGE